MMKKVYIIPAIEIFEMEAEKVVALSKIETGKDEIEDGDGDGFVDAMSNKRRPGSPWSSSWDTPAWGTEK
jgi:hypothetical protein